MTTRLLSLAFVLMSIASASAQVTGETNPCQHQSYTYTLNGVTCLPVQWYAPNGTITATDNKFVVNVVWNSTGSQTVTALTVGGAPGCNNYYEQLVTSVKLKPGTPTLSRSSADYEICSGESWTLTASLSGYATNYGYDWYATGGLLINGTSSSAGSPVHTSTNQVTLTPGGAYGTRLVYVRMNNYSDCPSNYTSFSTQVGTIDNTQFSIFGSTQACGNSSINFSSTVSGGAVTGYSWTAPYDWSPTTSSSITFYTTTPASFYGGSVSLQLQNRCGWTGTPAMYYVDANSSCGGGGSTDAMTMSASPNPASDEVNIEPTEESGLLGIPLGTIAQLYDSNGNLVKVAVTTLLGELSLDVRNLSNGLYHIRILDGTRIITKQVQIAH